MEHSKSTNALRNFFTAPTAALLGCSDEAGIWINCGLPHVWRAFWESVKVSARLSKDENRWVGIFRGSLGRFLPAAQRFARQQYPLNVIWVSGDATMQTVAVVSWFDKEFFVFDAPPLIREMKRDAIEEFIIGGWELLVTIVGALLWGLRNGNPES